MSNLVIEPDGQSPKEVLVGDAGTPIPFKVYQDIYHQITGRTEQIRVRYTDHLRITFQELEQLHLRLAQLSDVHQVIVRSETITVFHDKQRKEQYTSFQRFSAYNAGGTAPTVSVVMKYSLSILLPGQAFNRPQQYVITVRLTSRPAMLREAEEEAPAFMRGRLLAFVSDNTAEITVEYADYVVARGYLSAFEEWIEGCAKTPRKPWLEKLQRHSHLIPPWFRIGLVTLVAIFAWHGVDLIDWQTDASAFLRFLVAYGACGYLVAQIGYLAGHALEDTIVGYPMLSYLRLNRGDEQLVDDFVRRQKNSRLRSLLSVLAQLALAVAATQIDRLL